MATVRRWSAVRGTALALALLSTACGSHLSRAEILQADRLNGAGSGRGSAAELGGTGNDGSSADGATAGDAGASLNGAQAAGNSPAATRTSGASGATASGGQSSGSSAGAPGNASSAAEGGGGRIDNGGATDVGVKADSISLGNVSTLTGPVPGLFKGAVYGAQAVIAYQNSQGGIFGRKLKLAVGDDQLSESQNRA